MAIAYVASSSATGGNGTGTDVSVTKPAAILDGHFIIAVLYREAGNWTLPGGWAYLCQGARPHGDNEFWVDLAYKRASSEGASWTFQLDTSTWRVVSLCAFSGVISSGDPLDCTPVKYAADADNAVAKSITNGSTNSMNIMGTGNYGGVAVYGAGTSGYTNGVNLGGCEIWYALQASSGASGDKTFEGPAAIQDWATWHLSLKADTGSSSSSSSSSSTSSSTSSSSTSSSTSSSSSSSVSAIPLNPSLDGLAFGEQNPTQGEHAIEWPTWDNGSGGAITVIGDANWGKMELIVGAQGRSRVYDIGNANTRIYTLTPNRYGSGSETATLQIRGDTVSFNQDDASPTWETYTVAISRAWRYVQVREVKS